MIGAAAALSLSALAQPGTHPGSNDPIFDPSTDEGSSDLSIELFSRRHRPFNSWDAVIDRPGSADILFGVTLRGPEPYDRNADTSFKPASNSKLFTAGAALATLGADFRFETRLEWKRVDPASDQSITQLTWIASGDPSWGMEEFGETTTSRIDELARRLKEAGVEEVHGDIEMKASDPRWAKLRYPEGWMAGDQAQCYGALGQAFNLQINCATFVLRGPTQGDWAEFGVPAAVVLDIRRSSRTVLGVTRTEAGFRISGTWAKGTPPTRFYLPIADVSTWVKRLFIRALVQNGIRFLLPPTAFLDGEPRSISYFSPPLSDILQPFMKKSLNMMGDALFKALGEHVATGPSDDLVAAGQVFLQAFVAEFGLRDPDVRIFDGSGLSHDSVVTPRALLTFLEGMARQPYFPALWESLPIAGVDGTLINRMRGTPAEGILRAKTGTLGGTYNLSGYVPRIEKDVSISQYSPFVILTQTTRDKAAQARSTADRIGAQLSELVNAAH
ncbi:MAG: D-alanyl-D-alanine carboxypeptidase/D-alanyl-D-alanine-endopeptidase [Oligoflexia bacterium]|nr:D-alanyl-D-alanine carboxypeptidase/D-alanyl-D-alanine-endopeptidase [Oligoflexia bacterium]